LFVASGWCWFQSDFGTVLPVMLVLFADAFIACRSRPQAVSTAATGAVWLASIAPFIWFYELWGRLGVRSETWQDRFRLNLFNLNEYLIPCLLLGAAAILLIGRWKHLGQIERRVMAACVAIIAALTIWVPSVTTPIHLRYTIMAAPAACLIAAWFLVRLTGQSLSWIAWPAAAIVAATPWLSLPLDVFVTPAQSRSGGLMVRPEFSRLTSEVFSQAPDVNRGVIEWLRGKSKPTDEILVNYEDLPLVYYLPNPIRGGVADFRVEDNTARPPQFFVSRPFVDFVYSPPFRREVAPYQWESGGVNIPSALWGNNPDPISTAALVPAADVFTAIRLER
jgi:hypothetical protein